MTRGRKFEKYHADIKNIYLRLSKVFCIFIKKKRVILGIFPKITTLLFGKTNSTLSNYFNPFVIETRVTFPHIILSLRVIVRKC